MSNSKLLKEIPTTVPQRLRYWAEEDPDKPAFVFYTESGRLSLTRMQVWTYATRYAAQLHRDGMKKGDLVCNTLPNGPERIITDFAIMICGASVLSGMVFLADGADNMTTLRQAGCVAMIADLKQPGHALTNVGSTIVFDFATGNVLKCPDIPSLRKVFIVDCGLNTAPGSTKPFLKHLMQMKDEFVEKSVKPQDIAYVLNTSGTTGFFKLVPKTHTMLMRAAQSMGAVFGIKGDDVYFNDRSLSWIGGAPLMYLLAGVTRVLTDLSVGEPSDPLVLMWKAIKEEECSAAVIVPLFLALSLDRPALWKDLAKKIRVTRTGGQPVRKQHMEVIGKFTDNLSVTYGNTEMGFVCMQGISYENKDQFQDGDNGLPLPGFEIKILDENMKEVSEPGQVGEVLLNGGNDVFHGYMAREGKDSGICDGWFSTGDIGFRDARGHLFIVCRKSNGIPFGGKILYPGWLESRMEKCPGVQGVIVVAIPDQNLKMELCACIVTKPEAVVTEQDVKDFCKSALVQEHGEADVVPRFYLFFPSFPCTATGKLDRRAVRTLALNNLALQTQGY